MTPAAFASWLLQVLGTDKWYEPEQAARAFRLAGAKADPLAILAAADRAGWLEWYPFPTPAFCLPSRSWIPNQNTPARPATADRGVITS